MEGRLGKVEASLQILSLKLDKLDKLDTILNTLIGIRTDLDTCSSKVQVLESKVHECLQMKIDFNNLSLSLAEVKKSVKECVSAVDVHKKRSQDIETMQADLRHLTSQFEELQRAQEDSFVKDHRSCLELQGIHKTSNENLVQLIGIIGASISVTVAHDDLVAVYRKESPSTVTRPADSVSVRFKDIKLRDTFFKKFKDAKPTAKSVGLQDDTRALYVNEVLSPRIKRLLFATKALKKELGWHSVWTYKGSICVKKTRVDAPISVRTQRDLIVIK